MLITYRRNGGVFTLLVFVALAAVAVALTVTIGAIVLIAIVAVAAVTALGRALFPASWRPRRAVATAEAPGDVIEGTIVAATSQPDRLRASRIGTLSSPGLNRSYDGEAKKPG